ncbi:MAG: crAss001_48 related protein [Candidatus Cryptobacteroides sp.]
MKKYITTKTVEAELISIEEAEKIVGHIEIDATQALLKINKVYLIKDEDGILSCLFPSEFNGMYQCVEDFNDRLKVERSEVSVRLNKLRDFTNTPWFDSFPERTKELMKQQEEAMTKYLEILEQRIKIAL